MKKSFLTIFVTISVISALISQPCLPDGIILKTQEEIDSFQTDHPNCTEVEGFVSISGDYEDITNLNGLSVLTSIEGELTISRTLLENLSGLDNLSYVGEMLAIGYNDSLIELSGLESLDSAGGLWLLGNNKLSTLNSLSNLIHLGGDLMIDGHWAIASLSGLESLASVDGGLRFEYTAIINLEGLENLTYIGEYISLSNNPDLLSLSGLGNVNANSIYNLSIYNNLELSYCEVESICNIITNPDIEKFITENATGCNSVEEVEEACGVSIDENNLSANLKNNPNPFTTSTTIEYKLKQPETIRITFYNQFGKQVDMIEESQHNGLNKVVWTPENLSDGIYYFRLRAGEQVASGKLIHMKQ